MTPAAQSPAAAHGPAPRTALIHALAQSVAPINAAFAAQWPAARLQNLLDDSLSADLARSPQGLDARMTERFVQLADYAVQAGAQGILFTCSAFGPCIEAVARRHAGLPVLKPNEAMVEAVADQVRRQAAEGTAAPKVGLIATFAPTLVSMPPEFPAEVKLDTELAEGGLQALQAGDADLHDALAVEAAVRLAGRGCTLIALAQFSLARAAGPVRQATGLPVFTTPDTAVEALRLRLSGRVLGG